MPSRTAALPGRTARASLTPSLALAARSSQVKDRLAETKYAVLNAKEELEQLRAHIVPDPKRLKHELAALQEAVAHEKENVRQVEASGVEASRQLEAAERAEREMEAALHAQARSAQPAHPAPTHPAPHAPRPPCTLHDPAWPGTTTHDAPPGRV
jgi:septal ring factor EnvC (AmiA/AmiB activator)